MFMYRYVANAHYCGIMIGDASQCVECGTSGYICSSWWTGDAGALVAPTDLLTRVHKWWSLP
jgi:hypothetical protein